MSSSTFTVFPLQAEQNSALTGNNTSGFPSQLASSSTTDP